MTHELSSFKAQFNDKRFERISEKIHRIQNSDIENNESTLYTMETKLYKIETEIQSKIKDFDHKSKFLIEEFEFVNKLFERNVEINAGIKKNMNLEIKNLQSRIKDFYEREQEGIIEIIENNFEKFEKEFMLTKEEIRGEREELSMHIMKLKDFIDLELSKLNSSVFDTEIIRSKRIEEISNNLNEELEYFYNLANSIRTNRENDMADKLEVMIKNVKEELLIEKENRKRFEDEVINLIDETCTRLRVSIDSDLVNY